MPEHRWRLHYPFDERIEDTTKLYESDQDIYDIIDSLKNQIKKERRATISTSYTPKLKWNEEEIYKFNAADVIDNIGYITLNKILYKDSVLEMFLTKQKMPLYQNQDIQNIKDLSLLEFYADYENNKVYFNIEGFTEDFLIFLRYQSQNYISYNWFVSFTYPKYLFDYKLKTEIKENIGSIIFSSTESEYSKNSIIIITDKENNLIAYRKISDNKIGILPSYSNLIFINEKEIKIRGDYLNDFYLIICNSENNKDVSSDISIYIEDFITNERHLIVDFKNCYSFLTSEINFNELVLGNQFPKIKDINGNLIKSEISIVDNVLSIEANDKSKEKFLDDLVFSQNIFVYTDEAIEDINIKREEENLNNQNHSYFIWQFGKQIDENYFIERYKNHDSPVFSSFFHNIEKTDHINDYEWNPISYYITWDDKGCAFMFCEDPGIGELTHGFSYFGALHNLKNKEKDDYIGNFGSFGNKLLRDDTKNLIIPEFSGHITPYENNLYNIRVNLVSYYGPIQIQKIKPPIATFIDSEILMPVDEIITVDNPEQLLIEYLMIGAGFMELEKIELKYDYESNFWDYDIVFKDKDYVEPKLSKIQVADEIEVYALEKKEIILPPIINLNESLYTPVLSLENLNTNIDISLDGNVLLINPEGIVENSIIKLTSQAQTNKYEIIIKIPCEIKESTVIVWNFADITYEETEYE